MIRCHYCSHCFDFLEDCRSHEKAHRPTLRQLPHVGLDVPRLAPLPPEPTGELPGSPGKMVVLANRASAGVALWHPADATWERINIAS